MKKCKIEVPEIGSIVYNVGYSKAEKRYFNLCIRELTVTNWSYDYRYGLTVEGYVKGEYGSYRVKGEDIFSSKDDAESAIDKMKKKNI